MVSPAIKKQAHADPTLGEPTRLITVTTPSTYPIKQVEAQIAWQTSSGGLAMTSPGYAGDPPRPANGRIHYTFRASINPQIHNPEPVIRFVDQHGTATTSSGTAPSASPAPPTGPKPHSISTNGSEPAQPRLSYRPRPPAKAASAPNRSRCPQRWNGPRQLGQTIKPLLSPWREVSGDRA